MGTDDQDPNAWDGTYPMTDCGLGTGPKPGEPGFWGCYLPGPPYVVDPPSPSTSSSTASATRKDRSTPRRRVRKATTRHDGRQ